MHRNAASILKKNRSTYLICIQVYYTFLKAHVANQSRNSQRSHQQNPPNIIEREDEVGRYLVYHSDSDYKLCINLTTRSRLRRFCFSERYLLPTQVLYVSCDMNQNRRCCYAYDALTAFLQRNKKCEGKNGQMKKHIIVIVICSYNYLLMINILKSRRFTIQAFLYHLNLLL